MRALPPTFFFKGRGAREKKSPELVLGESEGRNFFVSVEHGTQQVWLDNVGEEIKCLLRRRPFARFCKHSTRESTQKGASAFDRCGMNFECSSKECKKRHATGRVKR